jgi:hypothetical protein
MKGAEMFRRFLILMILCFVGLAGCTPRVIAGPFVTSISYDDEGNLLVTTNTIVFDEFSGYMNSEYPKSIVIKTPKK